VVERGEDKEETAVILLHSPSAFLVTPFMEEP
jgi:hypothetical protein